MAKLLPICLFALVATVVAPSRKKSTCSQKDSCTCDFGDGLIIDLKKMKGLNKDDNKPMYKDFEPTDSPKQWRYSYKPCYSFTYDSTAFPDACKNVASCQTDTTQDMFQVNAGLQTGAEFWEDGDTKMIKYTFPDAYMGRITYVKLVCADNDRFEVQGEETGPKTITYDYTLYTPHACPSSGGGLSVGTILCIILLVLIIVYLVGGILFLKFRSGKTGAEMVPNVAFWKDFPYLIKDGALFIVSPIRKRGEYEKF